jgi:hypothetical protein
MKFRWVFKWDIKDFVSQIMKLNSKYRTVNDFQPNPGSQYANLFMTSEKVNGKSNLNHINDNGCIFLIW